MIRKEINDCYRELIFKLRKVKCKISFAQKSSKVLMLMDYIRAFFQDFNKKKMGKKYGINKSIIISSGVNKSFNLKDIAFAKKDTGQGYTITAYEFI